MKHSSRLRDVYLRTGTGRPLHANCGRAQVFELRAQCRCGAACRWMAVMAMADHGTAPACAHETAQRTIAAHHDRPWRSQVGPSPPIRIPGGPICLADNAAGFPARKAALGLSAPPPPTEHHSLIPPSRAAFLTGAKSSHVKLHISAPPEGIRLEIEAYPTDIPDPDLCVPALNPAWYPENLNLFAGNAWATAALVRFQVVTTSDVANVVEDELTSFKEHSGAFADCHDGCCDSGADICEAEREARRASEQKIRKCLLCRDPFPSAWAGERVCRKCKSTSTWRSSGME